MEALSSVVYEHNPEEYLWERGCLLRCEMTLKVPVYVPVDKTSDLDDAFSLLTVAAATKFKDPHVAYLVKRQMRTQRKHLSLLSCMEQN